MTIKTKAAGKISWPAAKKILLFFNQKNIDKGFLAGAGKPGLFCWAERAFRFKFEHDRIHAKAQAGWRRSIVKDMTEVGTTAAA